MFALNLQFLDQIKAMWGRLANRQRILIIGFSVATVVLIVVFVWLMNRTDYTVLFTGLNNEDSANVVAKLKEMKIEYRVNSEGSTIEVPTDKAGAAQYVLIHPIEEDTL